MENKKGKLTFTVLAIPSEISKPLAVMLVM